MDFAGSVAALDSVVKVDCEVTNDQGVMTEEFRKTLLSIPSNTNNAELIAQMEEFIVVKKADVCLFFEPSKNKATIRIKEGPRISTMNIGWGIE